MTVRSATVRNTRLKKSANKLTFNRRSGRAPESPAPGTGQRARPSARDHESPIKSTFTRSDARRPASATPQSTAGFFTENPRITTRRAKTMRMITGSRTRVAITSRHPRESADPHVDRVEEQERKDPEDGEQDCEDRQRGDLKPVRVLGLLPPRVQGSEDRALHRVDVVPGGDHDDHDGNREGQAPRGVDAEEDGELRGEPDQARKA